MNKLIDRTLFWRIVIACLGVAVPLALYAYNGSFMRYSGDDYCYASTLTEHGFWGMQWFAYTQALDYHGNRFTLTLFSGLAGLGPPQVSGLLPGLIIGLWLSGLVLLLRRKVNRAFFTAPIREVEATYWLIAGLIVFLTFYQAPEIKQSLYWRSGILPYLAPLVANTFLAYWIIFQSQQSVSHRGLWLVPVLLAWLAGGFSETGLAMQIAYLSIWLACVIYFRRLDRKTRVLLIAALVGSLLAFAMLALSPALGLRTIKVPGNPLLLFWLPLKFTFDFTFSVWRSFVLPTIFTVLVFIVVGVLGGEYLKHKISFSWRQWAGVFTGLVGVCLALIFAAMLPSAFAQSAYPEPRALLLPQFVLVVGLALGSILVGLILRAYAARMNIPWTWLSAACTLGLLVTAVYPVYGARNILSDTQKFQKWAAYWDARDQQIRQAAAADLDEVHVMVLDTVIPRVMELSVEASNWYNGCAAGYYSIQVLADQPGWDP